MNRAACVLFGILAAGLLGLAGYRYATDREPPPGQGLVIHGQDQDLGDRAAGEAVPVRVRLSNRSSRPIRIVGLVPD